MKPFGYHTSQTHVYDARVVAHALGGDVVGRDRVLAPGPGHSARDRSLSLLLSADAPDGFVVTSFAGDDWALCKDYVRERLGLPQWQPCDDQDRRVEPSRLKAFDRAAIDEETRRRERTEGDLARITRARALWEAAVEPRGTVAEAYLASRKLVLDDGIAGSVLRFHPACPWRDENTGATDYIPALIAAFRSIDDDSIAAVHRIRVDQPHRWPKTERRMLGLMHRAAVKLGPIGGLLHVGEGVETSLAARQLGYAPSWALGSVGMIAHFPVLDGVTTLRILGETGTASAEAIRHCGSCWQRAGRRVQAVMPSAGSDLNDELMAP